MCSMILCDDAVITHELTVRFSEDGSFQYLGNKILDGGISKHWMIGEKLNLCRVSQRIMLILDIGKK